MLGVQGAAAPVADHGRGLLLGGLLLGVLLLGGLLLGGLGVRGAAAPVADHDGGLLLGGLLGVRGAAGPVSDHLQLEEPFLLDIIVKPGAVSVPSGEIVDKVSLSDVYWQ